MFYVTGDTHGGHDMKVLVSRKTSETIHAGDYLIIAGDFGFIYDWKKESRKERTWLDWFNERPWTTLFVDGNHECFPRLKEYPEMEWNGGKVHKIRDSVFHLMRGQVFNIEGISFFTMGGAASHDRGPAVGDTKSVIGKYWWPEEIPCQEEFEEGRANLAKVGYKVDYIITHCLPTAYQEVITNGKFPADALTGYLQELKVDTQYKHWYCGHYHKDEDMNDNITVLFNKVVPLGQTVGKSSSTLGSPIYHRGDSVAFHYNSEVVIGTIINIYPWGSLKFRQVPVYDIETKYEVTKRQVQVPESDIDGIEKTFDI